MVDPQEQLEQAANVAAPQEDSRGVARSIAAAQTGKVGTDLGGAQTSAKASAAMVSVQDRMAAGRMAALNKSKQIKTNRDAQKQQGAAQQQGIRQGVENARVNSQNTRDDITAKLLTEKQNLSTDEKIAMGEQLDFLTQMGFDKTQADFQREVEMRSTKTAMEKQELSHIEGAMQALQDMIQELKFSADEAKKARDFNEANTMATEITKYEDRMAALNDQRDAMIVGAVVDSGSAGYAGYKEGVKADAKKNKNNGANA